MTLSDERDICHDGGDVVVFIPNYFAQPVFFALCLYFFDEHAEAEGHSVHVRLGSIITHSTILSILVFWRSGRQWLGFTSRCLTATPI